MRGNITLIRRIIGDSEILLSYEIIVEVKELPDLRLGECELKQK